MLRRPPVVVVEIGDKAAVGELTEDGAQRATVMVGVQAAMPPGRRITGIDHRQCNVVGTLLMKLIDQRPIALRPVDPEQYLDATVAVLRKHRLHRLYQRRTQNGLNDDRRIERSLQRFSIHDGAELPAGSRTAWAPAERMAGPKTPSASRTETWHRTDARQA